MSAGYLLKFKAHPATLSGLYAKEDYVYFSNREASKHMWTENRSEAAVYPSIGRLLRAVGQMVLVLQETFPPEHIDGYEIEAVASQEAA